MGKIDTTVQVKIKKVYQKTPIRKYRNCLQTEKIFATHIADKESNVQIMPI